jgi:tetratricopeptide (TPR) repeat protein
MILRKILLTFLSVTATVFAIAGSSALGVETAINPEIYGSWEIMNLEQSGMRMQANLIIKESQVISSTTCAFEAQVYQFLQKDYSVLAQTSSPAVITANEIQVLESNSVMKEYSPGLLQCRSSIDAGNMQYQLRNGKLVLSMPGKEETHELSRSNSQSETDIGDKKSEDSNLELTYTQRGNAYFKKGQYTQAIGEYNEALEKNPSYILAYYNRSVAYTRLEQYDRAVNDCNKALQLDPQHANSYYTRGLSYWHLGSKNQAIKDFQTAAKLKNKEAQGFLTSMRIKW